MADPFSLAPGLLEPGNIDLLSRPLVRNPDGSISTVRSMSANFDGREVLLPTVSDDGRIMSDAEAKEAFRKSGRHLGAFDTPANATGYAKALHDQQAKGVQAFGDLAPGSDVLVPPSSKPLVGGDALKRALLALVPDYLQKQPHVPMSSDQPGKVQFQVGGYPEIGAILPNLMLEGGGMLPAAGAKAGLLGGKGLLAMFAGPAAKTADHAALAKAEKMAAGGSFPDEIRDATGWFQGADKKWRFEIPDDAARFNRVEGKHSIDNWPVDRPGETTAGTAFSHPDLFAAYPDLKNLPFSFKDQKLFGPSGSYRPHDPLSTELGAPEGITLATQPSRYGADLNESRSTALHELTHAVQAREGFARGSNPGNFVQQDEAKLARDALSFRNEMDRLPKGMDRSAKENAVIKQYQDIGAMDWVPSREVRDIAHDIQNNPNEQLSELVKLYGLDRRTTPYSPRDLYRRQAGEVEARNVQMRADWGPQKRADIPPVYSQDTPDAEQVVSFGSLAPAARRRP